MFNTYDFLSHVLWYMRKHNIKIQNVSQVNRLIYIMYGIYLAETDNILLDTTPEAWCYGPVLTEVRDAFVTNNLSYKYMSFKSDDDRDTIELLLESTFAHFGNWSSGNLVSFTMKEGGAWYYNTKLSHFQYGDLMKNELIKREFKEYLDNE